MERRRANQKIEQLPASVKEIVEEVIGEAALGRAIDEGRDTARVTREEVFQIIEGSGNRTL